MENAVQMLTPEKLAESLAPQGKEQKGTSPTDLGAQISFFDVLMGSFAQPAGEDGKANAPAQQEVTVREKPDTGRQDVEKGRETEALRPKRQAAETPRSETVRREGNTTEAEKPAREQESRSEKVQGDREPAAKKAEVSGKAVQARSAETSSNGAKPAAEAQARPEARIFAARIASAQTAIPKTITAKSAEAQTAAPQATTAKSAEAQTTAPQTTTAKSAEAQPAAPQTTTAKSAEAQPAAPQTFTAKSAEAQTAAPQTTTAKSAEAQTPSAEGPARSTATPNDASQKAIGLPQDVRSAMRSIISTQTAVPQTTTAKSAEAHTPSAEGTARSTAAPNHASQRAIDLSQDARINQDVPRPPAASSDQARALQQAAQQMQQQVTPKAVPQAATAANGESNGNDLSGGKGSPGEGQLPAAPQSALAQGGNAQGRGAGAKAFSAAAQAQGLAGAQSGSASSNTAALAGTVAAKAATLAGSEAAKAGKAAMARLPVPPQRIINQVIRAARISVTQGREEMRLLLKPESLGWLKLKIVVEGRQVIARIVVEHAGVRELLEGSIKQLEQALQNQNLRVSQISIELQGDGARQLRESNGGKQGRQPAPEGRDEETGLPAEGVELILSGEPGAGESGLVDIRV